MVKNQQISFEELLLSEEYYLTNLDIALIVLFYNIPLIFLSSTLLIENKKSLMVVNAINKKDYYFLRSPGVRTEGYPVQRLFFHNNAIINIDELKSTLKDNIISQENENYLDNYIKLFIK